MILNEGLTNIISIVALIAFELGLLGLAVNGGGLTSDLQNLWNGWDSLGGSAKHNCNAQAGSIGTFRLAH